MAQLVFRGNLSSKIFPFFARTFGKTVIVSGQDQNFDRQVVSGEEPEKDRGIAQVYYCHNVMPATDGFKSISYTPVLSNAFLDNCVRPIEIANQGGTNYYTYSLITGNHYVTTGNDPDSWVGVSGPSISGTVLTSATIGGQTYLFFDGDGCYYYSGTSIVAVTLTALTVADIIGITDSFRYMIAWSIDTVFWSSTINPAIGGPIYFT